MVKIAKKLDFEFIKSKFEEKGYILLEDKYTNVSTSMKYICQKHKDKGVQRKSYTSLRKGHECKYCSAEKAAEKLKHSYEFVKQKFEDRGYELLETEYKNNRIKLKYRCSKHPKKIQEITYANLAKGEGCTYCANKRPLNLEIINEEFKDRGYKLLSKEYKNNQSYLDYICHKHPEEIQSIQYINFYHGSGCKFCAIEKLRDLYKLDIDFVRNTLKDNGYIMLDNEYFNCHQDIKFKCDKHLDIIQHASFDELRRGYGCKLCTLEKRSGKNHWNWQGGITPLYSFLRNKLTCWKNDSLKEYNNKCVISGQYSNTIHHLHSFNIILVEVLNNLKLPLYEIIEDYTDKELENITHECVKLHYKYGLGICLLPEIHNKFHSIYGYGNNTLEQFEEFKDSFNIEEVVI